MVPLLCAAMAAAGALAAFLAHRSPRVACLAAGLSLGAASAVALALPLGSPLLVGEASLTDPTLVRGWIAAAAASLAGLLILAAMLAPDSETAVVAPAALTAMAVALALDTPAVALPLAALTGLISLAGARRSWTAGLRQAALVPGLALAATMLAGATGGFVSAEGSPPAGWFAAPVLLTLALGLRVGLVPFHVAPLRVSRGSSLALVSLAGAWLPFSLGALGTAWAWSDERSAAVFARPEWATVLVSIASVTLVLAVAAILVQHDLGAFLSVHAIADGALILMALAAGPSVGVALMVWLAATAASRTVLAGWAMAAGSRTRSRSVDGIGGWMRLAPLLLPGLVLGVVVGIGWPGSAIFEARRGIIETALPGTPGILLAGASMALGLGYLRLLWAGLHSPPDAARARAGRATRLSRWLAAIVVAALALIPLAITLGLTPLESAAAAWHPFAGR